MSNTRLSREIILTGVLMSVHTDRNGALGGIRTHGLSLRRAALYPAELQALYQFGAESGI